MNAEEFLKSLDEHNQVWDLSDLYEYTEEQLLKFAESYLQHRVNEINDNDVDEEVREYRLYLEPEARVGFKIGAKWFKNKILKQ